MTSGQREIKFSEMLRGLLDQSRSTVTHKKLASAIGVSPATVSHYVSGRINPGFDALIGIAVFFNVTLDYLVFGERIERSAGEAPETLRASVRRALAEANEFNGRQRDLMVRMNRVLVSNLEQLARDLLKDPENRGPAGFFTDDEAMAVESCSLSTKVLIRTAPADLQLNADREYGPGEYFQTMVENLQARRRYQFLFYGRRATFTPFVEAYRELLSQADVEPGIVQENLEFRVRDAELPTGVVIHDIDVALLERREPILWERLRGQAIVNDTLAYTAVRHEDAKGGVVLFDPYLDSAIRMFKQDWNASSPL
jgi:transcriptional regulator with XRE-family HTH domain